MWQDKKLIQQKSVVLLCKDDKWAEEKNQRNTATNNIKYLEVALTKQVKDLYDKDFKSLEKN